MSLTGLLQALATLAATVVATMGLMLWAGARWYTRPRRRPSAPKPADAERVVVSRGSVVLDGWVLPPSRRTHEGGPAPAVVLTHGWSGHRDHLMPLARHLQALGFAILIYDTTGHGRSGSGGPVTIRTFADDQRAVVTHLAARPDIDGSRIGLVGHSLGASAALLAAGDGVPVGAVVALAAFAEPEDVMKRSLRAVRLPRFPLEWPVRRLLERWAGAPLSALSVVDAAARCRQPLLLMHGRDDRFIPPDDLTRIAKRAGEQSEAVVLAGAGHRSLPVDPRVIQRVGDFLARHLGAEIGHLEPKVLTP